VVLIVPAYAKLNLTLDVIGQRPDGYHDIDSVMQTISLHDLVWIERTDCRVFEAAGPPIEGENLVLKAARELEGATGRQLPFTIRLFKRIPMGAGMGGGSSDAAAFLKTANQLYGLRLKTAELAAIGARVGHDVPFLLTGGTARATGLGDTLSQLAPLAMRTRFLVVCPPVQVSTRTVYEAVDGSFQSAKRTPAFVEALSRAGPHPALPQGGREMQPDPHPDPPPQGGREMQAGRHPDSPPQGGREIRFGNDLESVTRRLFPAYDDAVSRLRAMVPALAMTGTGAALFAAFDNSREAAAALERVKPLGYSAWLARPVPAVP
jgi:4-diphosphocytidyl-2-C-methyl-D-erythritol kinase